MDKKKKSVNQKETLVKVLRYIKPYGFLMTLTIIMAVASVALTEDDLLVAEYDIQYKKTHSQTLLPMLGEIRDMTELDMSSVDAVALAAGPGPSKIMRSHSARKTSACPAGASPPCGYTGASRPFSSKVTGIISLRVCLAMLSIRILEG